MGGIFGLKKIVTCVWGVLGADFLCSRRNRQCSLASFQFGGGRMRDGDDEGGMKQRQRKCNNESELK